ncbi:hypothetical protein [Streptosporangium sp. NPDC002721]|uniref:hypothetical protein n=1 Tax=Streptosporangium sp. NPDC002721 TaxID=3366188 RepID=UPI0036BC37D3
MSARVAAAQARRELAFLEIAEALSEKLADAKAAKASNPGDEAAVQHHRAVSDEMHAFRAWARTAGKPREGTPGRDAVIKVGG